MVNSKEYELLLWQKSINIAIAEFTGWKQSEGDKQAVKSWLGMTGEDWGIYHGIPEYWYDLNDCYKFEETMSVREVFDYCLILKETILRRARLNIDKGFVGEYRLIHATSEERCEAFLRLKGKWKDLIYND